MSDRRRPKKKPPRLTRQPTSLPRRLRKRPKACAGCGRPLIFRADDATRCGACISRDWLERERERERKPR